MAVAHAAALATLPHHLLLEILEHRWLRCADEMLLVLVVHRWLLENAAANESQSGTFYPTKKHSFFFFEEFKPILVSADHPS